MKQYIVLISMVMLGMYIYNLVVGAGDDSIGTALQQIWKQGVVLRTYSP